MAANFDFTPAWDVANQGDRRLGTRQRKPDFAGDSSVYTLRDRRLGLGRRWADWCRPAAASTQPGVTIYTSE
jgi:hypothetical protein